MIKRYIEQLLEDIHSEKEMAEKRLQNLKKIEDLDSDCFCEDEIDTYGVKLSDLFELDKMFFPEKKMLTEDHMALLVDALMSLWKAYGLNPVFPHDVPVDVKYCQLRDHLDYVTTPVHGKTMDVELCDYLPEYCPFFSWCPLSKESSKCYSTQMVTI